VALFLEFTHNDTLDNQLRELTAFLMKFVRHAGKVVCSDALVHDNVLTFLECRSGDTVLVQNTFQKYAGTPAVRLRDESVFVEKLMHACANNEYFLFGCDSCDVVTKLYYKCRQATRPEDVDKYLLLTADTNVQLFDANEQFRNKFVFYSSKLTFGVDFFVGVAHDVFMYVKGNSLQPTGMFQQTTRCRNVRRLYYYGETGNKEATHMDLASLKQTVVMTASENTALVTAGATYLDENDEWQVVENTYCKLWCQNEYDRDTFETNKVKHVELLLQANGFALLSEGVPNKVSAKEKAEQKATVQTVTDEFFAEYLQTHDRSLEKFGKLNEAVQYLGLEGESNETLQFYQGYLTDKHKRSKHDDVVRLLRDDFHVHNKLAEARNNTFDVRVDNSAY
jgi:hypothetical protein